MRVADYVFKYLADYGIEHVFLVVGGAAMHLNDAIRKEERITPICTHHEQGASISAEGYSRERNKLSVVNVTSGPGGTNTLTGVICNWFDSVPVLYISGQVKYETTTSSIRSNTLRQLGDQELNIIDVVKSVTKYAEIVVDPLLIKNKLDKAIKIATSGRKGPVWLDIPLNIQSALINEEDLYDTTYFVGNGEISFANKYYDIEEEIKKSKRPLLIAGHGIRLAGGQKEFRKFVQKINIPVVTTFNGIDLLPSDHPNFVGRIGTLGSRAGNFALQNADLVLCIGTRNNIRQVSYNWKSFAKNAKKIIVDIDASELSKPTVKGDILIQDDAKKFLKKCIRDVKIKCSEEWLQWCIERKNKYPVVIPEYKFEKNINPYYFIEELTKQLSEDSIIVAGNGTACVSLFQAGIVKKNQRMFWNSGCATMGYGVPASIGASISSGKEVICIEGDGSIQMNLQELETIRYHELPIKIFVLNNNGYHSIVQTQNTCFEGKSIGCNDRCGVSFPELSKVADLYNLKYFRLEYNSSLRDDVEDILEHEGACICEVILGDYIFQPKLSSQKMEDGTMVSQPLENLFPFLSKEELESNMIKE